MRYRRRMRRHARVPPIAIAVLAAAVGVASPGTTTIPPGCTDEATFDSIGCRLDALIGAVDAAIDPQSLNDTLDNLLKRARDPLAEADSKAAAGHAHAARSRLRSAQRRLGVFVRRLDSRKARALVPLATRSPLTDAADAIADDMPTLRRSLRAETRVVFVGRMR